MKQNHDYDIEISLKYRVEEKWASGTVKTKKVDTIRPTNAKDAPWSATKS